MYSLEEKFFRFFYSDDVRMFDLVIRFKSLRERGTGDRFQIFLVRYKDYSDNGNQNFLERRIKFFFIFGNNIRGGFVIRDKK